MCKVFSLRSKNAAAALLLLIMMSDVSATPQSRYITRFIHDLIKLVKLVNTKRAVKRSGLDESTPGTPPLEL